jgi:hypothetical protein
MQNNAVGYSSMRRRVKLRCNEMKPRFVTFFTVHYGCAFCDGDGGALEFKALRCSHHSLHCIALNSNNTYFPLCFVVQHGGWGMTQPPAVPQPLFCATKQSGK